MAGKKILMLVGDFVEDYEVMVPFQALQAVGHTVHAVCPDKKKGDFVRTAVHDFDGAQTYSEKPGHNFALNFTFDEVKEAGYDALVIPGGRAPEYIRVDPDVRRIVAHFFDNDLPVGTLCHGPQVPAALGYLQGRKSSGFPPLGPDIELAGGTYVEGAAIVDGNMVSCTGWPDLAEWSKAFVAALERSAIPA